jgi:hypothetical protein
MTNDAAPAANDSSAAPLTRHNPNDAASALFFCSIVQRITLRKCDPDHNQGHIKHKQEGDGSYE